MEHILYGKAVADNILDETRANIEKLKKNGINPTLATIRIGNNAADIAYETAITKSCEQNGIIHIVKAYADNTTTSFLIREIEALNHNTEIHGIMMFRPFPATIDEKTVRNSISAKKDIDGISNESLIGILNAEKNVFVPCTALACVETLKYYKADVVGKNIVILGRSPVVGKPLAMLLTSLDATVTICHSKTKNIKEITKRADIIISCIGKAKKIDDSYVSTNQIIIDVGINFDEDKKLCGDMDFTKVEPLCQAITPVPKGIGAVTNAVLLRNIVNATLNQTSS